MYLDREYFKAKVYTIWVHGPFGLCSHTQRAQYPLIREYSLNHNMKPYII